MSDHHLSTVARQKETELIGALCQPPLSDSDSLLFVATIEEALTHDLDLNAIDSTTGFSPFHAVAHHIHSPSLAQHIVQRLHAAGARLEQQDVNGETPLQAAIAAGNTSVALAMLKMGASILRTGRSKDASPLEAAVQALRYPSPGVTVEQGVLIVEALRNAGEQVPQGSNCLILAAGGNDHGLSGDLDTVVQSLLDAGASVSVVEESTGRNPLHYAAMRGSWRSVAVLLKAGSDVLSKDSFGKLPFSYAEASGALGHELRAVLRAAEMKSLIAKQNAQQTLKAQVAA